MTWQGRSIIIRGSQSILRTFLRAYRSPYSLGTLYPSSSKTSKTLIPTTPSKPDDKDFNGYIPMDKVEMNCSMDESRMAEIRFNVKECDWIPTIIRDKFFDKYKHRIDKEGYFNVRSDRTMVASLNVADCLDKLRYSIRECAAPRPVEDQSIKEFVADARMKQESIAKEKLQVKRTTMTIQ